MKRQQIVASITQIPLDIFAFASAFFLARNLRDFTDLIPRVHLPEQHISNTDLLSFAIFGTVLFVLIQILRKEYIYKLERSLVSKLLSLFSSCWVWFLFFIATVYLGNGYLYSVEIPRLVIFFTVWIGFFLVALERTLLHF